jgi:hypothetical protein
MTGSHEVDGSIPFSSTKGYSRGWSRRKRREQPLIFAADPASIRSAVPVACFLAGMPSGSHGSPKGIRGIERGDDPEVCSVSGRERTTVGPVENGFVSHS